VAAEGPVVDEIGEEVRSVGPVGGAAVLLGASIA